MKTMYLTLIFFSLMACASPSKKETSQAETSKKKSTQMDINEVVKAYMTLKDSFVATDASAAQQAAKNLSSKLSENNLNEALITATNKISQNEDIKIQRAAFKEVTDLLIPVIKSSAKSEPIFIQYCPMAFNNAGANWLSLSEKIRNPYFGDMMLTCGKVEGKF